MTQKIDVITLLERQHEEIRRLFAKVQSAKGDRRVTAFHDLVKLLSVHETAEEELVHPEVHRQRGGKRVVNARLKEEHHAKALLSTLDEIGPNAEGFDTLLQELREDVLSHAEHEEREEFPLLRKAHDEKRLRAMADTVRAAEALAPTHPHPGVESATANLVLGPPTAVMDRTRDAIRNLLRQKS
jgi:hemerythrin superfamily protein